MSGPRIISLVPKRFEDGAWGGVPRFDFELRDMIDGVESWNTGRSNRLKLAWLAKRHPDTIVITGNETSMLVPDALRTIVVHHGCAATHYERDPEWRGAKPEWFVDAQRKMYARPNRWFVAIAQWTADEFARHHDVAPARVIPNWVAPVERSSRPRPERPVVLGDWRNFNKGRDALAALQAARPDLEFRTLKCTYETRYQVYDQADAYLCLSLSEGGSYSMSDAEAMRLPLVATDVGNHREYSRAHILPWTDRDDTQVVSDHLDAAMAAPDRPSFFEDGWTREQWLAGWRGLVEEVKASSGVPPLKP